VGDKDDVLDDIPADELLPVAQPPTVAKPEQKFVIIVDIVNDPTQVSGYLKSNGLRVSAKVPEAEGRRVIKELASSKPGLGGAGKSPPAVVVTVDQLTSISSKK